MISDIASNSNNVIRLRRRAATIKHIYPTGNRPIGIIFDGASIWVANHDDDSVIKIARK